jgi:hypothetical protein
VNRQQSDFRSLWQLLNDSSRKKEPRPGQKVLKPEFDPKSFGFLAIGINEHSEASNMFAGLA